MVEKITITREEFRKAVSRANSVFMSIGEDHPIAKNDPLTYAMMGVQNMVFGEVVENELFSKEDK